MGARRNFSRGGGKPLGGGGPKSVKGAPIFFRQALKYAYRGGGCCFEARRVFFYGAPHLLRWTSKIYNKGGMSLNVEKTKCMLFHKRRQLNPIQFSINGRDIDVVSHFNYLRIILDENISWKKHVAMITNKLSKISGVLHRLKYIYPQNILETIYKSLFVPHLNYGLLLWGRNLDSIAKFQKRAIRTITNSNFIAHSEPLLKELKLLNVYDMHDLKILKFMYKLYHNELPIYFDNYRPFLEKIETPYNLRPAPLPVPQVTHVYAEDRLVYKLVEMKNKLAASYESILIKLDDITFSQLGFSKYVTNIMLERYSYNCFLNVCRICGRP